ncbi:MAG: serine-rich protein [Anaerolineales bacterium]|jgi:hypothetical protein|nr:serine-rich protein [Anaerolineales bacterium]
MISSIRNLAPKWLLGKPASPIPDDLDTHTGQIVFKDRPDALQAPIQMDYIWVSVTERENGKEYKGYRVIRLLQIRSIPLEARADAGLLQKMRTVLRGMSGAQVNLAYLVAGIFDDPPLGIVQCYGTVTFDEDLDTAVRKSLNDIAVLEAGLKGQYRQLRLEPLSDRVAKWVHMALEEFPYAMVAVGHPDPRENARTHNNEMKNPLLGGTQNFSLQQNEILYRGMASMKEQFIFMVLGYSVPIEKIADMLAGYAQEASIWASQQTGVRSASFGVSLPAILSGAMADTASRGYGVSTGLADTAGQAQSEGVANTEGSATTVGRATTIGTSHTVSTGESFGTTDGTSTTNTTGSSNTVGVAHGTMSSSTSGSSSSTSGGTSSMTGTSQGISLGIAPAGVGITGNLGWSQAQGSMSGWSESSMSSSTDGSSTTNSESNSTSQGVSEGVSHGVSHSTSRSEAFTTSQAVTNSVANTASESVTASSSNTASQAQTRSTGEAHNLGLARSASQGLSVGIAPSFSIGNSAQWQNDPAMIITNIMRMQELLLTTASIEGAYYSDVYALTQSRRGLQTMMGLVPEAFQGTEEVVTGVQCRTLTEDEEAYIRRHARAWTPSTRVETIPGVMSGYMDSTMLTMLQLAAYTAPGVFEQGVALTTQEETPNFAYYPQNEGDVLLGRQWSVEIGELTKTPLRLSRDRHFHTAIIGDTGFGKTVAAETLAHGTTLAWHFRTIVLDFGQGWRRAANFEGFKVGEGGEKRVDVRQLFPGAKRPLRWNFLQLPKRIDPIQYSTNVATLFANAGRMGERQIGFMRRALVELYGLNGVMFGEIDEIFDRKMGPLGYQIAKLDREIRSQAADIASVLSKDGKLTNTEENDVRKKQADSDDKSKRKVRMQEELDELRVRKQQVVVVSDGEAALLGVDKGLSVYELTTEQQQSLAVQRSRVVSVRDWLATLREYQAEAQRKGDQVDRTSLEGVLLRLEQFEKGQMLAQYGPGPDCIAIEDLGLLGPEDDPWGITVVEGGAEMDEFAKAALFSLMAVTIYQDAVIRRREMLTGKKFPPLQIIFEEANKIFSGIGSSGGDDSRAASTAAIWESIFRDARKYKILLAVLAQTASQLPPGILSSCANIFIFQTKDGHDRDMLLPHIARSEKGLVNTEYKRYLARIPKTYAIVKLGYSEDVFDIEPVLMRPAYIGGHEPTDSEIVERFLGK